MHNRMIHNYFDVNIDLLWNTVKDDPCKLEQQTERLLTDLKKRH
jgi:uncharacterized protein with HEPN domain